MSELSDATAALTQAATSHGAAKAAFDAYLAALDEPGAVEALGFKRMKETRLHDDANPSFSYPGGTASSDATVTHTFDYQSAFPGEETELFFIWGCAARVDSNGSDNHPRGYGGITLSDGTLLTNLAKFGIEISTSAEGYVDAVIAASGAYTKPSGVNTVTLEQRCFMTAGANGAVMNLDNADILIREYVK